MRPEEIVETTICSEAIHAGWTTYKLSFIGTKGAPDRIFGKAGRAVLIEVKAFGEEPTRQQYKRHEELRTIFGLEVHWTDSVAGARRILNIKEQ